jgi:hypothetical protein
MASTWNSVCLDHSQILLTEPKGLLSITFHTTAAIHGLNSFQELLHSIHSAWVNVLVLDCTAVVDSRNLCIFPHYRVSHIDLRPFYQLRSQEVSRWLYADTCVRIVAIDGTGVCPGKAQEKRC